MVNPQKNADLNKLPGLYNTIKPYRKITGNEGK